jgi:phenylacetate-CoA ligase
MEAKALVYNLLLKLIGRSYQGQYDEMRLITTQNELLQFREDYLKKVLLHAYQNVPYYHNIFDEISLVRGNKVDLSRFHNIPLLDKTIIKTRQIELVSKDYKTRKWYYNSSGGSTGEPVRLIQDDLYDRWGNATSHYWYKNILGIDEPSVKKVILWGSERDLFQGTMGWKAKIGNWLTDTVFLNSFRMTEQDIGHYVNVINSYEPDLVRGYASSLYDLGRYAEGKGIKVYTPKLVISSAAVLNEGMRKKIERVFGAKVYDFYGSRESNNIAGECKQGLMHILGFQNHVEVLDSRNQPVKEGEEGKVIITSLHNYSMPLIRYDIGDMAILGPKKCTCGNPLQSLQRITGRKFDHFVKEDRTIISPHYFTHLFFFREWVRSFQAIQEDYKIIRLLVVLAGEIDRAEKRDIEDKIKWIMGRDCQVCWEFVKEIQPTSQGKHLYIKSLVQR